MYSTSHIFKTGTRDGNPTSLTHSVFPHVFRWHRQHQGRKPFLLRSSRHHLHPSLTGHSFPENAVPSTETIVRRRIPYSTVPYSTISPSSLPFPHVSLLIPESKGVSLWCIRQFVARSFVNTAYSSKFL